MPTDASGERVSKYDVIRLLGSGGMGEVYLARDTVLNREVAIKFVSRKRLADATAEQRLLHEARAAAALDHPSICPIYDVHVDEGGRTCIVMQFVEGETLSHRLAQGPIGVAGTLALARDIADALAAAHARGIVHRDLKPQNVIVTPGGRPKLLDFGIAQTQPMPADVVARVATHTDTGARALGPMVGTPAYMSPEQVLQKPVDGRSDLFSLGAVLYECLTGQPAFLASTDIETWARVVYANPPSPSSFDPRVSPALDALVGRLLAKEPAARFASAADLVAALNDLDRAPAARAIRRPRRLIGAAIAAGVVALTGFGIWRMTRPSLPEPPPEARTWYERGVDHIRNGAYYSAQRALNEAIRLHAQYPQAYVRLAEASSELDEERDAQSAVLHANALVPDLSLLSEEDGRRLTALRAIVLGDTARAVAEYQHIADANPRDAGAWLDLGRIRQTAGFRDDARKAFQKAVALNGQYAAAHLRLAAVSAADVRRDEATREFDEAERLYRLGSDFEGQTEVLIQRGLLLNALGDVRPARSAIDAATALATQSGNPYHRVRAMLAQSSVTGAEGDSAKSRELAERAVEEARRNSLDTVAADGLIDVGVALYLQRDFVRAQAELERGVELAKGRGASRIVARGALQLGAVFVATSRPQDALNVVNGVLPYIRASQLRRYELLASSIMSRAHEDLGEYSTARALAEQVVAAAEAVRDENDVANGLASLASLDSSLGALPRALAAYERVEAMNRRLNNRDQLPYNLAERAALLIRLGRPAAAEAPLAELQAGIATGVASFVSRERRLLLLRAIAASIELRFADAETRARQVLTASASRRRDTTVFMAAAIVAHARARLGRPADPEVDDMLRDPTGSRRLMLELRDWSAATSLARGGNEPALAAILAALPDLDREPSAELEWRLAATGAIAARRLKDARQADALAARARAALARLHQEWKTDAAEYDKRPDVVERKRAAGVL